MTVLCTSMRSKVTVKWLVFKQFSIREHFFFLVKASFVIVLLSKFYCYIQFCGVNSATDRVLMLNYLKWFRSAFSIFEKLS